LTPDLTILFDISPEKGLSRAGAKKDRIESRSLEYHKRVRNGYLELSKQYPERIKLIKVDADKEEIFKRVKIHIDAILSL
jgi:dTMP kinase